MQESKDNMDVPKLIQPCETSEASTLGMDRFGLQYMDAQFIQDNCIAMKILNLTWEESDCEDDADIWECTENTIDIKPPKSQLEAFRAQIPHQSRRAPFGVRRESYVKNFAIGVDFPHYSVLTSEEQAKFLELSQKFSIMKFTPSAQKEEFANFQKTNKLVAKEQREYTTFARKQSINFPINYEQMPLRSRRYIEKNLHTRQKAIPYQYPKLYHFYEKVRFGENIEKCRVEITSIQELKSLGTIPHFSNMVRSDNLKEQQVWLPVKLLELLERRYPSDDSISRDFLHSRRDRSTFLHHTPVSQDGNAQQLAEMHEVDVVVSSSALQLLVDCHPDMPLQNCAFPRDLPITVRCYTDSQGEDRKVVYIDKALPPVSMSAHEKKQWLCRRALRLLLCQQHKRYYSLEKKAEENKENEDKFEETLKQFFQKCLAEQEGEVSDSDDADTGCTTTELQKVLHQLFPGCFEVPPDTTMSSDSESDDEEDCDMDFLAKIPAPGNNVTYSLFNLSTGRQEHRTGDADNRGRTGIKILVRTSIHAYEWDRRRRQPRQIHTSLKLEHQPEYGAQLTSCSEIAREWMALLIRPNTILCRVRVNAENLKVIQSQHLTLQSLQAEAKARSMDLEEKLGALHHLLSRVACLNKGHFLLKLEAREKTATIIEEDTSGTNLRGGPMFHLHLEYKHSTAESGPTSLVPYCPIDCDLATPYHIENKLIPAMFPAADTKRKKNKKKANRNKKKLMATSKTALNFKKQPSSSLHGNTQTTTESSNNSDTEVEPVVKKVAKIDVEKPPSKSHSVKTKSSISSQRSVGKMLDFETIEIEENPTLNVSQIDAKSSEVFQFAATPKVLDSQSSSMKQNKAQCGVAIHSEDNLQPKIPPSTSSYEITPKVLLKETVEKPTYQAKTNVDEHDKNSLQPKIPPSTSSYKITPKVLPKETVEKPTNQAKTDVDEHDKNSLQPKILPSTSSYIPSITPKMLSKETVEKPTYQDQANVVGGNKSSLHHKLPQTVSMSRSNVRPKVLAVKKPMNPIIVGPHQILSPATNISQIHSPDVKPKPLRIAIPATSVQGYKMSQISNTTLQKYKIAGSSAETQKYLLLKSEKNEAPIQIKTEKFTKIRFVPATERNESIEKFNVQGTVVTLSNTPQIRGEPGNQASTLNSEVDIELARKQANQKEDKTINVDAIRSTIKAKSDTNFGKLKSIVVPETKNLDQTPEPKSDSEVGGILEILNDPKTIISGRIPKAESVPVVPKVEVLKTRSSPPAFPLVYCDLALSDDSDGGKNDSPPMKRIYDSDLMSIETVTEETVALEPTLASVNVPAVPREVREMPNLGFTEPEISDGDFEAVIEEYGNPVELQGEAVLDIDDLEF